MSNPQKRKGDKAELEAAALLAEHKRGEPPCDACREAKRAGRRSRYLAS